MSLSKAPATEVKCCWNSNIVNIGALMTGFIRVIDYRLVGGEKVILGIYEGEIEQGLPNGFGRKISARTGNTFVGNFYTSWRDDYNVNAAVTASTTP